MNVVLTWLLPGKVVVELYKRLFEDHPDTTVYYEGCIEKQGDIVRIHYSHFPKKRANFFCDKKLTIPTPKAVRVAIERHDLPGIEWGAREIADIFISELVERHPVKWKCFAGQIVNCSKHEMTLVYGIELE